MAVLVSDAAANGRVRHVLYPARGHGRAGRPGVVTLLALLLVAASPALWRATAPA